MRQDSGKDDCAHRSVGKRHLVCGQCGQLATGIMPWAVTGQRTTKPSEKRQRAESETKSHSSALILFLILRLSSATIWPLSVGYWPNFARISLALAATPWGGVFCNSAKPFSRMSALAGSLCRTALTRSG